MYSGNPLTRAHTGTREHNIGGCSSIMSGFGQQRPG